MNYENIKQTIKCYLDNFSRCKISQLTSRLTGPSIQKQLQINEVL
jgi:hypothetical protein